MALSQWLARSRPRLILAAFCIALTMGGACNCDDPDPDPDPDVVDDIIEDDVVDDVDEVEDVEEDVIDDVDIPDGMARVQFVHDVADPAGSTVDVYLNDDLTIDDFEFRTATPFLDIDAGTYDVTFAGADSDGVEDGFDTFENVEFEEGVRYLVVASGVVDEGDFAANPDEQSIGLALYALDNALETSADNGTAQMVLFHGVTDAPSVGVEIRGDVLVDELSYGEFTDGYLTLPSGVTAFDLVLADTRDRINSYQTPTLDGGDAYVAVASGFLDTTQNPDASLEIVLYRTPVGGDRVEGVLFDEAARMQLVHDSVDPAAALVDVYVDGVLVAEDVEYRTATAFMTFVADQDLEVAITEAGVANTEAELHSQTVNLDQGSANIAVVSGVADPGDYPDNPDDQDTDLTIYLFDDARESGDDDGFTDIVTFHGVLDAPDVALVAFVNGDETTIIETFRYGSFSEYVSIESVDDVRIEIRDAVDETVVVKDFEVSLVELDGDSALLVLSGLLAPEEAEDPDAPELDAYLVSADGTVKTRKDEE